MDATAQAMSKRNIRPGVSRVKHTLGYDLASNRLWCQNVVQPTGQDEFYTYDGLYQLKEFQRGTLNTGHTGLTGTPAWEEDFTLDPTGNWDHYTNKVSGALVVNQDRTQNQANEILTISGGSSIAQNAAGNITNAPVPWNWNAAFTQVYDAWNRLVSVSSGGVLQASYAYDGQGWRVTKTTGSTVRHYYYTSAWQVVLETLGSSPSANREYVWGLLGRDNLVWWFNATGGRQYYPMADPNGCVTALVNESGVMEERYGYEAYGAPRFMNPSFGAISSSGYDFNILYDGYRRDEESGFYQVRWRYLHPTLGRWLTRDPIGYRGGLNLYAYVGNRPVNRVDAYGLTGGNTRYSPPFQRPAPNPGGSGDVVIGVVVVAVAAAAVLDAPLILAAVLASASEYAAALAMLELLALLATLTAPEDPAIGDALDQWTEEILGEEIAEGIQWAGDLSELWEHIMEAIDNSLDSGNPPCPNPGIPPCPCPNSGGQPFPNSGIPTDHGVIPALPGQGNNSGPQPGQGNNNGIPLPPVPSDVGGTDLPSPGNWA